MPFTWFIVKPDRELGPYTSAQIKQLAASGQLKIYHQVRRDDMKTPVSAAKIQGLFPEVQPSSRPKTVSPPLPVEQKTSNVGKHAETGSPQSSSDQVDDHPKSVAKDQGIASWIFGSILLTFFLGVFIFAPKELPEFKQRMLAFASAILAGFFGFFFTGSIRLELKVVKELLGELGVKATGGASLFILVLLWWLSPLAPVKASLSLTPIRFFPDTNTISVLTKDVGAIYYSFDGQTWKEAARGTSQETFLEGVRSMMGKIDFASPPKSSKLYVKYTTTSGVDSPIKEFPFNAAAAEKRLHPVSMAEMGRSSYDGKSLTEDDFKRMFDDSPWRELSLSNAVFDEENLRYVKLMRPDTLRLNKTQVTDRGVKKLEGMSHLVRLDLAATAITDESMRVIAGMPSLQELNLSHTKISDEGIELYCQRPLFRHFKLVDLRGTLVTDRGVKRLRDNIVKYSADANVQILR